MLHLLLSDFFYSKRFVFEKWPINSTLIVIDCHSDKSHQLKKKFEYVYGKTVRYSYSVRFLFIFNFICCQFLYTKKQLLLNINEGHYFMIYFFSLETVANAYRAMQNFAVFSIYYYNYFCLNSNFNFVNRSFLTDKRKYSNLVAKESK
jgi:hypothetical protein